MREEGLVFLVLMRGYFEGTRNRVIDGSKAFLKSTTTALTALRSSSVDCQSSNEISLRSVWMERGRGILRNCIKSAAFHIGGKYLFFLIEALKIAASG